MRPDDSGCFRTSVAHVLCERRIDVIELAEFARLYGRSLGYFVPKDV